MALRGKKFSFGKVIVMVDEMVALLAKKQADDDSKKEIVGGYAKIFAWELARPRIRFHCHTFKPFCVHPDRLWASPYSVAQARLQRQSGQANGARVTVIFLRD